MTDQHLHRPDAQDFLRRARARLPGEPPVLDAAMGRPAAVLMPLIPVAGMLHFLFTVRPATMPSHAGEICFPGGRLKAGEDALAAALREAEEEVGISPEQVQPLGFGAPRKTASGHVIAPLLGLVEAHCCIRPCAREVAEVFTAPLSHFLDAANFVRERRRAGGQWREYWVISWQGRCIWGATAAMLHDLMERLA